MNREIRFRAYQGGRMRYFPELRTWNTEMWECNEDTPVMQFTGLHDRQGLKIYEGDILLTNEAGWRAKVIYSEGAFILADNNGGFSTEPEWWGCEVIGNVYEDPELLED